MISYYPVVSPRIRFPSESPPRWWICSGLALFVNCLPLVQAVTTALAQVDREKIYQWINELSSPETRENALLELSKKRESVPDLAPMLWHSCGTIAALLQVCMVRCYMLQSLPQILVCRLAVKKKKNYCMHIQWHVWCVTGHVFTQKGCLVNQNLSVAGFAL